MTSKNQAGGPTPQPFSQMAKPYQRSHPLKAAIDLDLFTAIGKDTVQALLTELVAP